MIVDQNLLKNLSKKYQLNFEEFYFKEIKKFFKKKYYIYYSRNEYFFEVDNFKKDLNNYFPYFASEEETSNLEIWIKSISLTNFKKNKIVSDLKSGLDKRNNLKKKYKI